MFVCLFVVCLFVPSLSELCTDKRSDAAQRLQNMFFLFVYNFVYLFTSAVAKDMNAVRRLQDVQFPGLSILTTASIKPELHSLHPHALIGFIIPKDIRLNQQMIANITLYLSLQPPLGV